MLCKTVQDIKLTVDVFSEHEGSSFTSRWLISNTNYAVKTVHITVHNINKQVILLKVMCPRSLKNSENILFSQDESGSL